MTLVFTLYETDRVRRCATRLRRGKSPRLDSIGPCDRGGGSDWYDRFPWRV